MAFLVKTAGDARLIGDDKRKISGIVDRLDGFPGAVDPFQSVRLEGVAGIMIEYAVAIEEHRGASQPFAQLGVGPREILGDADVDEIAAIGRSAHGAFGRERGEYVLFERSGEAIDPGDDRAIDYVDTGIDGAGGALAGRDEGTNPVAVQHDPAEPVAHDIRA